MKSNNARAGVLAGVVALSCVATAACGPKERSSEAAVFSDDKSGVSVHVPDGWTRLESKTKSIAFFGGPVVAGFRQTMMIQEVKDSRTLEEFVQKSLNELQGVKRSYIELERVAFETASHLKGIRLVIEGSPTTEGVIQRCY